ncbi:hypothetical protein [Belnapia sp. F-4-1]|nr:hypothetical protein [Belnapia sp. F-4-1]
MDRDKQIALMRQAAERHTVTAKAVANSAKFKALISKYADEAKPKQIKRA